ncbi:MAG: hypothetical protein HXX15_22315, partial [Rhodopseudomonas sp.]|nr:hypothetical protein [Rhodopseudomonas sp.]
MSMIDLSASSQRELNPALQRALGDRSGAADLGGFLGMLDSATAVDKEAPANAAGASGNFGSAEPAQTPIGSPAAGPDAAAAAAAAASAAAAAAAAAA